MKVILTESQLKYILEISSDDLDIFSNANVEIIDCAKDGIYELCLLKFNSDGTYRLSFTSGDRSVFSKDEKEIPVTSNLSLIKTLKQVFYPKLVEWATKYSKEIDARGGFIISTSTRRKHVFYYQMFSVLIPDSRLFMKTIYPDDAYAIIIPTEPFRLTQFWYNKKLKKNVTNMFDPRSKYSRI